jgi:ankyrin repeat protein
MLGTLSGDVETVKAILALQPDLEKLDRRLNSVLHFAATCEIDIFRSVLRQCLKRVGKQMLYQRNNRNATPLHFACYSEAIDNVLYMLRIGLNADCLVIEPPIDLRSINSHPSIVSDRSFVVKTLQSDPLSISAQPNSISSDTVSTTTTLDEARPIIKLKSSRSNQKLTSNTLEVAFTDEMLEDMDVDDIKNGGSPLHWCMYRRTLERLLQYDLRLDAIDLNHESALFRSVSKHRLRCMLYLLNAGADPNMSNMFGNGCLHEAVLKADIPAVQALVCWDCQLDNKNQEGNRSSLIDRKVNEGI